MTFFRVGPAGIPGSIKTDMNNVLNKKFGTTGQDYPPTDWPADVNLLGMLEVKTASKASVCSFSDGADDVPMQSVIAHIAPTLTGKNAVSMVQAGKNLLDLSNITNGDWTHTGAEYVNNVVTLSPMSIKGGANYIMTCSSSVSGFYIRFYDENDTLITEGTISVYNATSKTFTAPANAIKYKTMWYNVNGLTTSDVISKNYMIEVGSVSSTFEAYEAPTTYTANLGRTVYGADVDLVSGQGTDTTLRYELDENDSWSEYSGASHSFWHNVATGEDRPIKQTEASASICNYATYSSASPASAPDFSFFIQGGQRIVVTADSTIDTVDKFKTWLSSHNLVFVCPASTPQDFTFDGQEIPSMLGVNNLWHDTGDTQAEYRSSGTVTPVVPTLITKTITDNGTYSAEDDDADGYSEVTVNVEGDEDMNYSTTEHEVGTWIDGSTIYERTFELESQLTVSYSTWTSSGISGIGIAKIMGVELFGVSNYQGGGLANIQSDMIMLQTTRNSDAYVKEFSLRYTKTVI